MTLGGDEEHGRDGVAEGLGLPHAQGSVPAEHVWPRTAFVPGPEGTGILPDHRRRAPAPRQSSAPGLHGQSSPESSSCRRCRCCRSVPFRRIPQSSEPQRFSRSGFPKTEGKFCVRSGEGKLAGTCNPSLAETANCF